MAFLADGERWRLLHGDCLRLLADMPDGAFDCVVTDPPFGVRDDEWDDMDSREFARFSMSWLCHARRVGRELVSFCSAYGPFRPLCEALYPRVRVMIWDKPIGSQYAGASERKLWFSHETILHGYTPESREYVAPKLAEIGAEIREAREKAGLSRGGVDIAVRGKKTGLCYRWEEGACLPTQEQARQLAAILPLNGEFKARLADAYGGRDETMKAARAGASVCAARGRDVLSYRTVTNSVHPCEKPLQLMRELVRHLTEPNDIILDPFAGSGTTGVAALQEGRRFVGIELSEHYAAIARDRLAGAAGDWAQTGGLFAAVES